MSSVIIIIIIKNVLLSSGKYLVIYWIQIALTVQQTTFADPTHVIKDIKHT